MVANRILELRSAADLSQAQLAARVKPPTSPQQIAKLEKSARRLTQDWMQRLGAALGVRPEQVASAVCGPDDYTELLRQLVERANLPDARTKALLMLFETGARSLAEGASVADALSGPRLADRLLAQLQG